MGLRSARRLRRLIQSAPIMDCAGRNIRPDAGSNADVGAEGYVAALLEMSCPLRSKLTAIARRREGRAA